MPRRLALSEVEKIETNVRFSVFEKSTHIAKDVDQSKAYLWFSLRSPTTYGTKSSQQIFSMQNDQRLSLVVQSQNVFS